MTIPPQATTKRRCTSAAIVRLVAAAVKHGTPSESPRFSPSSECHLCCNSIDQAKRLYVLRNGGTRLPMTLSVHWDPASPGPRRTMRRYAHGRRTATCTVPARRSTFADQGRESSIMLTETRASQTRSHHSHKMECAR